MDHKVDYRSLAEYYMKGGTTKKAKMLYLQKHGHLPLWDDVKRAVQYFGDRSCKSTWRCNEKRGKNEPTPEKKLDAQSLKMKANVVNDLISGDVLLKENKEVFVTVEVKVEENEIDLGLDYKETAYAKTYNPKVQRRLIIYTTRLEDMLIFKEDFYFTSLKNFLVKIEFESKPLLNYLLPVSYTHKHSKSKYQKVKEKIKQYNYLVTAINANRIDFDSEDSLAVRNNIKLFKKSKELLKKCRECSIVLTDCKPILNNQSTFMVRDQIMRLLDNTNKIDGKVVIFLNYNCNTTEIFLYNHSVPTHYYHIDRIPNIADYKIQPTISVIKYSNCCWCKRRKNVEQFCSTYRNKKILGLYKTPHSCLHNQCTCCCKKHLNSDIWASSTKATETRSMCYRRLVNTSSQYRNNSINNALSYKSENKNTIDIEEEHSVNLLYKISLRRKSKHELYKMRPCGEVVSYVSKISNMKAQTCDKYAVCCWYKQESLISKIDKLKRNSNFYREPHSCPPLGCTCCCRKVGKSLKEINLPSIPEHSKNCSNKIINDLRKYIKRADSKKPLIRDEVTLQPTTKKNDKRKNIQLPETSVLNVDNSQELPVATSQIGPKSDLPMPLILPELTNAANNKQAMPTLSQDPTVNGVMKSILERFKNIRLTVNANGKVAAELEVPAQNLSTDELRILSKILSHVQGQVKSQGLGETASQMKSPINISNVDANEFLPNNVDTGALVAARTDNDKEKNPETPIPCKSNDRSQNDAPTLYPVITDVVGAAKAVLIPFHGGSKVPILVFPEKALSVPCVNLLGLSEGSTSSANSKVVSSSVAPSLTPINPKTNPDESAHMYADYSKLSKLKYVQYMNSFLSYRTRHQNFPPIIQNVFSLSNGGVLTKNKEKQPEASTSQYLVTDPVPSTSGLKRKCENKNEGTSSAKIRVISASDLLSSVQTPRLQNPVFKPISEPKGVQSVTVPQTPMSASILQPILVSTHPTSTTHPELPNPILTQLLTAPRAWPVTKSSGVPRNDGS